MPKCPKDCNTPKVLEIHNHECPVLFHRVLVPAAIGDDETNPPRNGQYRNVLLVYEANDHVYLFSSDGIPTFISDGRTGGVEDYEELLNKPLINGHELIGDSSLEDIGVTDAIDDALDDYTPTADLSAVALSGDYDDLINKPTIPTVNDATLTIQKEGSSIGTFTANSATNTTINVVETDPTVPSWAKQPTKPTYSYSEITNKPTIPTKTSDLTNDGSDGTSTYVESDDLATVATSGSYNDLSNKPTIPAAQVNSDWNASSGVAQILNKPNLATVATTGSYNDLTDKPANFELVEMSYGESNAWAKFIAAYQSHKIVYCRASFNTNPATGAQGRKAFMACVDNAETPTYVEFQYVRSVVTKTAAQPVDQVFVYTLKSRNGGTWAVETRNMAPKLAQGTNTTVSYSNGTYTISATQPTVNDATLTIQKNNTNVATFTANASSNVTANISVPTATSDLTNDSGFITSITKITNAEIDAIMGVS